MHVLGVVGIKMPVLDLLSVKVPDVKVPGVKVPGVKVPGVKVPGVKVPGAALFQPSGCLLLMLWRSLRIQHSTVGKPCASR
jgi:hypothetical protein